jgi:peptide/nickel transport system permease protein
MTNGNDLKRFLIRRMASAIPTVFFVLVIAFCATRLAPGDPITYLAGEHAPQDLIQNLKTKYGLDQPLYVQFGFYLKGVLHGDFGYSFAYRENVLQVIRERMTATLVLMGASILFALIIGILLAVASVKRLNSLWDHLISSFSMIGYSLPVFWLAQLLVFFLAVKLELFPAGGMIDLRAQHTGFRYVADVGWHLILPVLNLGLIYTGLISRLARAEMAEILTQDFILTARSKGIPERRVMRRHVLRNALGPVTTMTGVLVGLMFSGAIFTETIFSWPGLGRLLYDALFSRDYPVITAIFTLTSLALVVVTILVDLLYTVIDPRITVE